MSSRTRPGSAATRTARPRADLRRAAAGVALALAGLGVIPGCLSADDEKQLSIYRYNSKAYYDAADYARAEDQCRRGLKIDDDDHALSLTLGFSLLMQADPKKLEEARKIFDAE